MADNHIQVLDTEDDSNGRNAGVESQDDYGHSGRPMLVLQFIRRFFRRKGRRRSVSETETNSKRNQSFKTESDNDPTMVGSDQRNSVRLLSKKRNNRIKSLQKSKRNSRHSNFQYENDFKRSKNNHRKLSWKSFKKSFKRSRRKSECNTMNEDELNITIDVDGQRREDSPILKRSNQPSSVEIEEKGSKKFDANCLKTFSEKKEMYCIPRMICNVINCPWYWGNIDRIEAATALNANADGYFLLRKSAHPDFLFTISFKSFKKTMHVRIESGYGSNESQDPEEEMMLSPWVPPGRFFPTYARLLELIDMCQKPFQGNYYDMPFLVTPLKRKEPLSLKELARSQIYTIYQYSSIESLNIPEELKIFLKDYRYKFKNTNLLPGQKYV